MDGDGLKEQEQPGESEMLEEKIAKYKLDQQHDGEEDDDDDDDIESDPDLKSSGDDHPDTIQTPTAQKTGTMMVLICVPYCMLIYLH